MLAFARGVAAFAWVIVAGAWTLGPVSAASPVESGDPIRIYLDQAKLLKLPSGTATLVVVR